MRLYSQPVMVLPVRPMARLRAAVPRMRRMGVRGMGTTYGGPCNWSDDYCNSHWSLLNPAAWAGCCTWVDAQNAATVTKGLFETIKDQFTGWTLPPIPPPPPIGQGCDPNNPSTCGQGNQQQIVGQLQQFIQSAGDAAPCAGVMDIFTTGCPQNDQLMQILMYLGIGVGAVILLPPLLSSMGGRR